MDVEHRASLIFSTNNFVFQMSFLFGLAFPLLEQEGRRRRNKRGNSVADYIIRDSLAQVLKKKMLDNYRPLLNNTNYKAFSQKWT